MKTFHQPARAFLMSLCAIVLGSSPSRASIVYGSINNFDTVNDTGHECHGFEIEIEDCRSTDISYLWRRLQRDLHRNPESKLCILEVAGGRDNG